MSDRPTQPWPLPLPSGEQPPPPPLSVWPTGQRDLAAQHRDSGCVLGTATDTDQIPPAVAAHAIATYTHPGELVLDPDCGAGTVLVEALRAGRHALGLTARTRWWAIARANITATKRDGAWRDGSVLDARPTVLATVRAAGLVGRVGLVLTTLRTPTADETTSSDRTLNSALADLTSAISYCEPLLRSGGHLAVVARPRRHPGGALADLTTQLIAAAAPAGLVPVERCVALTASLRGNRLITRASHAERRATARARAQGKPVALTAHHDVLIFQLGHEVELAATAAAAPWPGQAVAVPRHRTHRSTNGVVYPDGRRVA